MSDLTLVEMRQYLEERWDIAIDEGWYVYSIGQPSMVMGAYGKTEEEAISAAYDMTHEREEEIRLAEQEMYRVADKVEEYLCAIKEEVMLRNTCFIVEDVRTLCAYTRTYQKQLAELATLKAGMKEGA